MYSDLKQVDQDSHCSLINLLVDLHTKNGIMQENGIKIRVEKSVDPDQLAHLDLQCFP